MDIFNENQRTPNHLVDSWLGTTPPFSKLGYSMQTFKVKSSYKGINKHESIVIDRLKVEIVLDVYQKAINDALVSRSVGYVKLNENDFYSLCMSRGLNKNECFYFYDRLINIGGYDGNGANTNFNNQSVFGISKNNWSGEMKD